MVAIEKCMALYRHFKHVSKDCPECPLPDLEGPLSRSWEELSIYPSHDDQECSGLKHTGTLPYIR